MSELLSWLRATITADLAAAKAADEVAPGPWVNTGQDGDAWQIHGAPTGDTTWKYDDESGEDREVPVLHRVATLNYDDGGGVWEREAADHIVLQQPRDTIARCEAELALLGQLAEAKQFYDQHPHAPAGEIHGLLTAAELLATGYQHRPGFNPEWVSD